jgi:hypothetical protein
LTILNERAKANEDLGGMILLRQEFETNVQIFISLIHSFLCLYIHVSEAALQEDVMVEDTLVQQGACLVISGGGDCRCGSGCQLCSVITLYICVVTLLLEHLNIV